MNRLLRFGRLAAVLLLPVAWPGRALSADEPASSAKSGLGTQQMLVPRNPGQLSTLHKIDDHDPESSVPSAKERDANPLEYGYFVQDLLAKGERATKDGDIQSAIKYYRALAIAVPDQAAAWGKLCETYQLIDDREHALRACKFALDRGAQLQDYMRYVDVMVAKKGDLSSDERDALNEMFAHLDQQPDLAVPTAHLRCKAAVKMDDAGAMGACTSVLAKAAPDDPKTIVFQWSYAVMRGDRAEAARLVSKAEKAGIATENLQRMSKVTRSSWRSSRLVGVFVLAGAAVLLGLLLVRRRLITARRLAP